MSEMKRATSAKPLFKAIRGSSAQQSMFTAAEDDAAGQRRSGDFYATPRDATVAFLEAEGERIRGLDGGIWEPAAGDGAILDVLREYGIRSFGSDIVDRGAGTAVDSFYNFHTAPFGLGGIVTNPPFCEISAGQSGGRWLRHTLSLGIPYFAYLLSSDWAFGKTNGFDALLDAHPPSREYKLRWKLDFTGKGSPPQRNCWYVWDSAHQGEPVIRWLNRPAKPGRQATTKEGT